MSIGPSGPFAGSCRTPGGGPSGSSSARGHPAGPGGRPSRPARRPGGGRMSRRPLPPSRGRATRGPCPSTPARDAAGSLGSRRTSRRAQANVRHRGGVAVSFRVRRRTSVPRPRKRRGRPRPRPSDSSGGTHAPSHKAPRSGSARGRSPSKSPGRPHPIGRGPATPRVGPCGVSATSVTAPPRGRRRRRRPHCARSCEGVPRDRTRRSHPRPAVATPRRRTAKPLRSDSTPRGRRLASAMRSDRTGRPGSRGRGNGGRAAVLRRRGT